MNHYSITFHGRLKNAIGICYYITDSVYANNEEEAILKLYDKYENIHHPIVKLV